LTGWSSVLWATASPAQIGLALAWLYLKEPVRPERERSFNWLGAVATVTGLTALVVAMNFSRLVMGAAPS